MREVNLQFGRRFDVEPAAGTTQASEVRRHVAEVSANMSDRLAEITASMRDVLATRIQELDGDPRLVDMLGSSIAGNVENILQALQHDVPLERIEPPSAAYEYARRLAQRGVPVNALVRAYRLGQQHFMEQAYAESAKLDVYTDVRAAAYEEIAAWAFDYIDWISQRVVTVYEAERDNWLAERNASRLQSVTQLIEGEAIDDEALETALGYRLRVPHLGVIVWAEEHETLPDVMMHFSRCVNTIAERIGAGSPLVIAQDRVSAWAWIPMGNTAPTDAELREAAQQKSQPQLSVALGTVHSGPAGFRQTHLEARAAQQVGVLRSDPADHVVSFSDRGVGAVALLSHDLVGMRAWVRSLLGDLLIDDEQHERLRDTLLTFLQNDGSYTATAATMVMHKNSVKYRVTSAEKVLGRKVADDRLDIELALTACRWLGVRTLNDS